MNGPPLSRSELARHEAAHAVVGAVLGRTVFSVRIDLSIARDGRYGECHTGGRLHRSVSAMETAAGPASEIMIVPQTDVYRLDEKYSDLGGSKFWLPYTRKFMKRPEIRPLLATITNQLLHYGDITETEFRATLNGCRTWPAAQALGLELRATLTP